MRKKFVLNILVIGIIGFQSCQKNDFNSNKNNASENDNLTNILKATVADVVSTQINLTSTEDIQGVSLEKFDGTDFNNVNFLGHLPPRDHRGHFMGMDPHLWEFRIPHFSDCATVTVSDTIYPKEITIDYGSGCTDGRGTNKKG